MPKQISKYKTILQELGFVENATDNDLVSNLLIVPKKDNATNSANTFVPTAQYIQQADLLFLQDDNTVIPENKKREAEELKKVNKLRAKEKKVPLRNVHYRYALVVVDIGTGLVDAEPLKFKYSFIVRDALKRIYARKFLKVPHELEVDAGSEFKDEFLTYFNTITHVRRKESGRHRAQAVVEGVNGIISKLVQRRQIGQEIINKETSREWVEDLPKIIIQINKHYSHDPPKIDPEKDDPVKCKEGTKSCDMLAMGTPVRVQLDNPVDAVETKRLNGSFRIGDIRWSQKIGAITQVFLRPNFPIMYQVDNNNNVAYTRNQLQVVKSDEKQPYAKNQRRLLVEELVERIKKGNKIYYRVKWSDGTVSDQLRSELYEDIPGLIDEFEDIQKNEPRIIEAFKVRNKVYFKVNYKNKKDVTESRTEFNKVYPSIVEAYEKNLT